MTETETIRFGVSASYYSQHVFATELSKFIGFPMLCMGVILANSNELRNEKLSYVMDFVILVVLWYLCEKKFKVRRYEMILYALSVLLIIATGENCNRNK